MVKEYEPFAANGRRQKDVMNARKPARRSDLQRSGRDLGDDTDIRSEGDQAISPSNRWQISPTYRDPSLGSRVEETLCASLKKRDLATMTMAACLCRSHRIRDMKRGRFQSIGCEAAVVVRAGALRAARLQNVQGKGARRPWGWARSRGPFRPDT